MVSSSASSYCSMWQSMGGHHSSTITIVVIVLTATVTLLLPSPASSFVVQQVPEVQPVTRTTMPMTLRSSSMRLVSSQVMSSYPTTTTTTSLYVSRKDRYSRTIINRSLPGSTSHHHHHTATSDTLKKGGALEDHWSDLWQEPAAYISHHQHASSASAVTIIPIQNEIDIALLQRHLIEGIIEHQTLLDSVYQHVEQPSHTNLTPQQQSSSVEGIEDALIQTTSASKSTIIPVVSDVWKARLLLLLSAALYGTNFTLVKTIDDIPGMSVGLASTFRFGFAALVMLPLLFTPLDEELTSSIMTLAAEEPTTQMSIIFAGMEIGLYNSIGYLFQAEGLKTTTASKSAFICSMACLTVPILDYIWGKKLLRRQVIGAILAAVGVFALEMGGEQTSVTNGDWESLVQPIVFGLGFWRLEAAVEKYPTETGRLASSQLVTVFLVSLLYLACPDNLSFLGGSSATGDVCNVISTGDEIISWLLDPQIVGMFLWTGIVTTAFTIYMETLALKTLSAAETTLIFSTEPLFGAAFAAIVANEVFGLPDAIGAAFIILGCVISGMDVGSFFGGGSAANNSKT